MSINRLEYVLAIAEEQNITKAAKKLFISQPALTLAINRLENELGVKLFDRQNSPVKLTPAGVLYIQEMRHIQKAEYHLKLKLQMYANQISSLTIGIGHGRGQYWLPIILPDFKAKYPDIQLHIHNGNYDTLEQELVNGSVDIAFGSLNFSSPQIHEEFLLQENLIYLIPKSLGIIKEEEYAGHSIASPLLLSPEHLQNQPFIYTEPGNSYYRYLEHEITKHHFQPRMVLTYSQPSIALKLASKGLGIFFTSQRVCEWEGLLDNPDVYYGTLSEELPCQRIRLFYNNNPQNFEMIQYLIEIIKSKIIPAFYTENLEKEI